MTEPARTPHVSGVPASHFTQVALEILEGDVVPVLGAGANRCDRAQGETWALGTKLLPDGGELSEAIAKRFGCDVPDRRDLVRVSQAAALTMGDGALFQHLRKVFIGTYEPTSLHHFLAGLPAAMARRGVPVRPQLIVTTNYDDLLERAFDRIQQPYDVVYYLGQGEEPHHRNIGKFVHIAPGGERHVVHRPNKYVELTPETRPVILKVHGAARENPHEDSWVITEDHYIDYLTRTNLSELIPVKLLERLLNSHFLFLGYAMKDWNLRVMLHRIWIEREHGYQSWAVQLNPDALDEKSWETKGVDIQAAPLHEYVQELQACLETVEL
jgi:hypothetical protein